MYEYRGNRRSTIGLGPFESSKPMLPPTALRRGLLLVGAVACAALGFALLLRTGLPAPRPADTVALGDNPTLAIGARAPAFTAVLRDGSRLRPDALRGSVVVLNFWATWCAPCEIEMGELDALSELYTPGNLRVVAVNAGEDRATIDAWMERLDLQLPVALDHDLSIGNAFRVVGLPTTYVIDTAGFIRHVAYGPTTRDALRAAITPFLPGTQRENP